MANPGSDTQTISHQDRTEGRGIDNKGRYDHMKSRKKTLPHKPLPSLNSIAVRLTLILLLLAGLWSTSELKINVASIIDSFDNAAVFIRRMFPLDFPPTTELFGMLGETLGIVLLATLLAVVLSLPLALFAAWNTTNGRFLQAASRSTIVLARAVPDLILAIVFIRIFGLGALPGILALGLHSVGMIGKLYADAIESLDNGAMEAIRASGGSKLQQIFSGILPPLFPQIVATALHRFDINLRTSVLLGYVGVGGIGLEIADAFAAVDYQRGMALAVTVLLMCVATELISGFIRKRLLGANSAPSLGQRVLNFIRTHKASTPGTIPRTDKASETLTSLRSAPNQTIGASNAAIPDTAIPDTRKSDPGASERESSSGGIITKTSPPQTTPPWTVDRVRRFLWVATFGLIILASLRSVDISGSVVSYGLSTLPSTIQQFFPPSTGGILDELLEEMLLTIQIALSATFLGTIIALPLGLLAARNIFPNSWVHSSARIFIVFVRGIPELIVAIVFVVISGLGAVAGTLALAVGAVGLLSKLVADSLEETDTGVQDALRANGASRTQIFCSATLRQAAPAFIAHILYLLDHNIRSATLLGIVGAGGIGFLLLNATRVVQFDVVTAIVLMILAVVLVLEALSLWIRREIR